MIGVIGVITVFTAMVLTDIRRLLNTNHRIKTMVVYFAFVVASVVIGSLISINKRPPSPAEAIESILRSIKVVQ